VLSNVLVLLRPCLSLLCPTLYTHTAPIRRIRPSSSGAFAVSSRPAQPVCVYACVCVRRGGGLIVYVSGREAPAACCLHGARHAVPCRAVRHETSRKRVRQRKRGRWGSAEGGEWPERAGERVGGQ
jgi:hypothetical protein